MSPLGHSVEVEALHMAADSEIEAHLYHQSRAASSFTAGVPPPPLGSTSITS